MNVQPALASFQTIYDAGGAQIVRTCLVGDLETPVSAFLKLSNGSGGNVFLLESVEGGAVRGRYSMIGLAPDLLFRVTGETASVNRAAQMRPDDFEPCSQPPLDALRS